MTTLSPAIARLEALIAAGDGAFVAGAALASGIGIPMASLSGFVAELRRRKPDLCIEGKRGHGYRLVVARPADTNPPAMADASIARPQSVPAVRADPLNLFTPTLAELVRTIALESGETIDAAIARLVAYGAEVHRELVMSGENPLGLGRPKSERHRSRQQHCDREPGPARTPASEAQDTPSGRHN